MKTGETFRLRLLVVWAAGVTLWYCAVLGKWISPRIIKCGLPLAGSLAGPDIPFFLSQVGVFAFATACVLLIGDGAGRDAAAFIRLESRSLFRSAPLGLALLAAAFFGLGLAGLWYRSLFAVLAVTAAVVGALRFAPRLRGIQLPGRSWWSPEISLPLALVGWIALLICLAPESFQDPLRYHLFFPRRFLFEHKFVFVERYFFWSYMGLPHMLYAAALALGGGGAAKAVNAAALLLGLAALLRITRLAGMDEKARAVILCLAVTAPGMMFITGATFGEHAWVLYVLLAVESLLRESGSRSNRLREACLMGGLAFSAKYTAVFGAAGCVLLLASRADRRTWIAAAVRHPGWLAALAVPFLPYAAERWLWTGDPVSPYMGRAGFNTLDSSSAIAIDVYYKFTRDAYWKWIKDPGAILRFPMNFAGAHGGFWEHAGPAIPALLPVLLFYKSFGAGERSVPASAVRQLLSFFVGSFGVWLLVFGGISPHYVTGLTGIWTAGFVGAVQILPQASRLILWNLLGFIVLFQTLIAVVSGTYMFGPRDVAMGAMTREYYLGNGLAPAGIHYPIRRSLMREYPGRGVVYVLGDDTSYYLDGRVFVDYENGSDPLLWRLAEQSPDPGRIRIRLKQRGITHILYSTRWPDILCKQGDEKFRFDDAVMRRMQEFWRRYAVPVLFMESSSDPVTTGSYVFVLSGRPSSVLYRADFSKRFPFLPGAGALVWEGDAAFVGGDVRKAARFYEKQEAKLPSSAIIQDRLARVALVSGDRRLTRSHLKRMETFGWTSPGLVAQ